MNNKLKIYINIWLLGRKEFTELNSVRIQKERYLFIPLITLKNKI